jgi:hypothetical protein
MHLLLAHLFNSSIPDKKINVLAFVNHQVIERLNEEKWIEFT